jgi:hypothetical protein
LHQDCRQTDPSFARKKFMAISGLNLPSGYPETSAFAPPSIYLILKGKLVWIIEAV